MHEFESVAVSMLLVLRPSRKYTQIEVGSLLIPKMPVTSKQAIEVTCEVPQSSPLNYGMHTAFHLFSVGRRIGGFEYNSWHMKR